LQTLKNAGFKRIGFWALNEKRVPGLRKLRGASLEGPAIYLFVVNGRVKYVGKAHSISARLNQYVSAFDEKRGTRKVDDGIRDALKNCQKVKIYTFAVSKRFFWRKGVPFDFVVGLEDGLIKKLAPGPEWNKGVAA
jgi:hypothetical protein